MIYDCFTFFNELDLLEIRLNILNDTVDKFVLVEATKTHSGKNKPLYFEQNKERFKKFCDKIIHIVVDDYPEYETSWTYENYQRNCITRGLINCKDNDIILISDLDEIPNPQIVTKYAKTDGIKLLEQNMYYYFVNCINVDSLIWPLGTKILSYKDFLHSLDNIEIKYNDYLIQKLNEGTTPTKIRMYLDVKHIKNAGWHFSYCGGVEAIAYKIKSFSHQEFNSTEYTDLSEIEKRIKNGEDIFGRKEFKYEIVKLDSSFPKYILDNKEKYSHLIYNISEQCFWYQKIKRILFKFIFKFLELFIPVKSWRKKFRNFYILQLYN